jgi:hypothetical protein
MVTTPLISEFVPHTSAILASLASGLLLFVSAGVIYLSAVDWRDRRRRQREQKPRKP